MQAPDSLDGFDVIAAVERMLGQPALWWQALALFVEHFADWERSWQESVGDEALERRRVHALRSAAANVGAVAVVEAAGALEDLLLRRAAGDSQPVSDEMRQRLLWQFQRSWRVAAQACRERQPASGGAT